MKEEILKASIALFEEQGFTETSIQEITDRLDVTKGTFYYYFTSKEQVLMTIHSRYIDHLLKEQKHIMNCPASSRKKLERLVHMLISNIAPQGRSARVFFREIRHLSDKHLEEVRPKRDQIRLGMKQVIVEGIKAGEFRKDLEADIVTLGILGSCNWTYQWFHPDGEKSDIEIAQIYVNMILEGINT
ncbi:TetR/AcrR family transcriptional regulator [Alteribacillus sp. HJP-4]|uniref:TetR/AcrR family transcriptional regulator n=1 Tax=Alteribacillus sp. HJP-4 TaxID=2775394 RepID=UPI0035CCCD2F